MQQKIKTSLIAISSFVLLNIATTANSTHISTTTCTNSCVTTIDSSAGTVSTVDCCGGVMTTVYQAHGYDGPPGSQG